MDYTQSLHNKNVKNENSQRKMKDKEQIFKLHVGDHYICKCQSRNNSKCYKNKQNPLRIKN